MYRVSCAGRTGPPRRAPLGLPSQNCSHSSSKETVGNFKDSMSCPMGSPHSQGQGAGDRRLGPRPVCAAVTAQPRGLLTARLTPHRAMVQGRHLKERAWRVARTVSQFTAPCPALGPHRRGREGGQGCRGRAPAPRVLDDLCLTELARSRPRRVRPQRSVRRARGSRAPDSGPLERAARSSFGYVSGSLLQAALSHQLSPRSPGWASESLTNPAASYQSFPHVSNLLSVQSHCISSGLFWMPRIHCQKTDQTITMVDVKCLSDYKLQYELDKLGFSPGPILPSTRRVYENKLMQLLVSTPCASVVSDGPRKPDGTEDPDGGEGT
ncbi:LEM domain-containing protein 1 [Galemys pyrenaicus]|uniref:LEM domain-containing protein 1 n=1 Tax=Galemys pyrenaicus TaxID=202257 RepID=A0A8J6AET8_GALPY|nr:LEM domain-containing protein 1 [Galemys pyrenaicus]